MTQQSDGPDGEVAAALARFASYVRGERGDLEPGDMDRVSVHLDRLRAIESAARALIDALAADEEWDHMIVEPRTLDAASTLRRLL